MYSHFLDGVCCFFFSGEIMKDLLRHLHAHVASSQNASIVDLVHAHEDACNSLDGLFYAAQAKLLAQPRNEPLTKAGLTQICDMSIVSLKQLIDAIEFLKLQHGSTLSDMARDGQFGFFDRKVVDAQTPQEKEHLPPHMLGKLIPIRQESSR
jgi:hypothetical protein